MYNKQYHINTVFVALLICLLAGVASAQTMKTTGGLNGPNPADSILPKADPYCDGDYPGISGTFSETTEACFRVGGTGADALDIPAAVVDWVLVELRAATPTAGNSNDASANNSFIARKPAFLLANGRVVDAAGFADSSTDTDAVIANCTGLDEHALCPDVEFEGEVSGNVEGKHLYVVVRHRNHLDVISNTSMTEVSGTYSYDFSTAVTQARASVLKAISNNAFALIAGDANASGGVNAADYTDEILPIPNVSGYNRGDISFNKVTNSTDYTSFVVTNNLRASSIP